MPTAMFGLQKHHTPGSKVHGANMWPTWVLSSPGGLHVGPVNLAIRDAYTEIYVGKDYTDILFCWK